MRQVIYVATMDEAITMAMKLSRENEYPSDKEFKGVIIHVKK